MANLESNGDSPTFASLPPEAWRPSESSGAGEPPPAETPAADATSAIPPASATISPVEAPREGEAEAHQDGAANGTGIRPPIPFDRHEAVLAAERQKLSDLDAKYRSVAWAEELTKAGATPETIRQALDLFNGVDTDPVGFLERFFPKLLEDPTLGVQARSWAGRVLASQRVTPQADGHSGAADQEPGPDLYYDDPATGRRTFAYSPEQQARRQEWFARQVKADVDEKYGPLLTEREQRQRSEAAAKVRQQAVDAITTRRNELLQNDRYREHEKDVVAYLESKQWKATLDEAWIHVLQTKVLPTLSQTEQAKTIADLKTKAAASSARPGAAAPSTPPNYRRFTDIPREQWRD